MAQTLSECCITPGTRWEGTPVGSIGKIGGLDAYISKPSEPTSKAVILIADIWGWEPNNPRLIADAFAAKGFLAVLPDFFIGNPYRGGMDMDKIMTWLALHKKEDAIKNTEAVVEDLKANHGIAQIGTEGFCWGGLYSLLLAVSGKVDAAVITHGSFITAADVEAAIKPVAFLCASSDQMITPDVLKEFKGILATKDFPTLVKEYPDTEHGFSVRGDKNDEHISKMAEECLSDAISFLTNNFSEE